MGRLPLYCAFHYTVNSIYIEADILIHSKILRQRNASHIIGKDFWVEKDRQQYAKLSCLVLTKCTQRCPTYPMPKVKNFQKGSRDNFCAFLPCTALCSPAILTFPSSRKILSLSIPAGKCSATCIPDCYIIDYDTVCKGLWYVRRMIILSVAIHFLTQI